MHPHRPSQYETDERVCRRYLPAKSWVTASISVDAQSDIPGSPTVVKSGSPVGHLDRINCASRAAMTGGLAADLHQSPLRAATEHGSLLTIDRLRPERQMPE